MSKAFTKESDDAPDDVIHRRGVPLPEGVPNYLTAAGARALRAELDAAPPPPRALELEDRMRELAEHLAAAEIVEPPLDRERVGFGAAVTVEDEDGARTRYRIVGAIEAAPREGSIGWQSPVALALLGARIGDAVTLPRGGEVEVVAIDYD
ncbi:MAG: GreA/GreB family elongation factor [Deltaproteobacteria bacterium]|nr:GreA/GreB family elongation factor [Deltaproteobacteria bacterium]